jgi:hypothetical protein
LTDRMTVTRGSSSTLEEEQEEGKRRKRKKKKEEEEGGGRRRRHIIGTSLKDKINNKELRKTPGVKSDIDFCINKLNHLVTLQNRK